MLDNLSFNSSNLAVKYYFKLDKNFQDFQTGFPKRGGISKSVYYQNLPDITFVYFGY